MHLDMTLFSVGLKTDGIEITTEAKSVVLGLKGSEPPGLGSSAKKDMREEVLYFKVI